MPGTDEFSKLTESNSGDAITYSPERIEQESQTEEFLKGQGIDFDSFRNWGENFEAEIQRQFPGEQFGFEPDEPIRDIEEVAGFWSDLGGGLFNSFVDLAEGTAALVPQIALAAGSESDFWTGWIDGVDRWSDARKHRLSDKARMPLSSDWGNMNAWGATIGEGIGFMASILATRGMGGMIGKGVSSTSVLGKTAGMLKTADTVLDLTQTGKRVGSFMGGMVSMTPGLYEEALGSGLSPQHAARFALATSTLVSLTEGAALEWMGKSISKPVVNKSARNSLKESLSELASKKSISQADFEKTMNLTAGNFVGQVRNLGSKAYEGAAIEAGQEFSQTYIEEGMKFLYDELVGKSKKKGKGTFGAKLANWETLQKAMIGGVVGGMIGGTMSIGGSLRRGLKGETLHAYVDDAVRRRDKGKIDNLRRVVDSLESQGTLGSDKEAVNSVINEMVGFSEYTKGLNIDSPAAKYQAYQMMQLENEYSQKTDEKFPIDKLTHKLVADSYRVSEGMSKKITETMNEDLRDLIDQKKPLTSNREKFEGRLGKYQYLYKSVLNGKINEEQLDKQLKKLRPTEKAEKTEEQQKPKFEYVETEGGIQLTPEAIKDRDKIVKEFQKAYGSKEQLAVGRFTEKLKEEYGITPEAAEALQGDADIPTKFKEGKLAKVQGEVAEKAAEASQEQIEEFASKISTGELAKIDELSPEDEQFYVNNREAIERELKDLAAKETATPALKKMITDFNQGLETAVNKTQLQEAAKREGKKIKFSNVGAKERTQAEIVEPVKPKKDGIQPTQEELQQKDKQQKTFEEYKEKYPKEEISQVLVPELRERSTELSDILEKTTDPQVRDQIRDEQSIVIQELGKRPAEQTDIFREYPEETVEELQEEAVEAPIEAAAVPSTVEEVEVEEVGDEDFDEDQSETEDFYTYVENNPDVSDSVTEMFKEMGVDPEKGKEQRLFASVKSQESIKANPDLYKKIKGHFKKIFPNVPVQEIDDLALRYGVPALARVTELGIQIDKNTAVQSSLIHEYSHIYLKVLGTNNPIVKVGLDIVSDTDFYREAKELYPHLTDAEIREEALAEAIAQKSFDSLRTRFEGNTFDKFLAFAKRFWNQVKRLFTKPKSRDIVQIISEGMSFRNSAINLDSGFLNGMNKNQMQNPRFSSLVTLVQNTLTAARIKRLTDPDFRFDATNPNNLRIYIYGRLAERYIGEKNGAVADDQVKIFDGYDLAIGDISVGMGQLSRNMFYAMQAEIPEFFRLSEKTIESIAKIPIPEAFEVETDSKIKADQKISDSIRSIVTSIVDENGQLISSDNVYRYISSIANNSLGTKGFLKQLQEDSKEPRNVEAKRLLDILGNMPSDARQSTLTELASLIQIGYRGIVFRDENGNPSITIKKVNEDYETKAAVKEKLDRLESFNDNPVYYSSIDVPLRDLISKRNQRKFVVREPAFVNDIRETVKDIYQMDITEDQFNNFIDQIKGKSGWGLLTFMQKLSEVINQKKPGSHVSGFTDKLIKSTTGQNYLQNTFVNMNGNSVSSTRFGYWLSELNSLIFNDPAYREKMQKSFIYKDNPVFKQMVKDKKAEWFIHDSISNTYQDKAVEYTKQSPSDMQISGLVYFANNPSRDHYHQTIGATGDRGHLTYFRVPRYKNVSEIKEQFSNLSKIDQRLFDEKTKGKSAEDVNSVVQNYNKMSLNKIVNGKVLTPFDEGYPNRKTVRSDINKLKSIVSKYGLNDAISKDNVGNGKMFDSLDQMIENYYMSDAINRQHLHNLYEGPMIHRNNVADVVKRSAGLNSGGKLIEFDKPVKVIVVSGNSDSFSFNGSHLHEHISEISGSLDKVGPNVKDQVYQVNPTNGNLLFMKMSSIGITGDIGNNNLTQMSPVQGEDSKSYNDIGDAILKLEQHLATDDNPNPYIKIVDKDAMKGSEGDYTIVDIDQFVNDINSGNFDNVVSKGFDQKFDNYRVSFNLNKDLTKVPLSEQSVILSTQLSKISLNNTTESELNEFENSIVDTLKTGLKMTNKDSYQSSKIYRAMINQEMLLRGLTKNMDEFEKNSIVNIFKGIQDYNTENPSDPITSFDHPNLVNIVQQFVSSKLSKAGIRTEIPGAYVHMLPNYGQDLKWYNEETGEVPQVALPWSMFGNTEEGANALLARAENGLRTVVVRVPASGPMSTFVAKVKYFTDGKANTAILPDEFVEASDADHDADKVFVYREELNDLGGIVSGSEKAKVFNNLYNLVASPSMVEGTKQTLDLKVIKDMLDQYGFNQVEGYTLSDSFGMANISDQMSFGGDAIGILAVGSKMLSVLNQSGEQLKEPINFGYDLTEDPALRRLTNDKELQNFENKSIGDIARLLQAALDMGKDPILPSTGINKNTISVATTLTLLGVDIKDIMGFLNDPAVIKLNEMISSAEGIFQEKRGMSPGKIVESLLETYDAKEAKRFKDAGILVQTLESTGGVIYSESLSEGLHKTVKGDAYFTLESIPTEEGRAPKFKAELVDVVDQKQDLAVMKKYIEVEKVAQDIKKIIPVIQLDKSLPNNGQQLYNLHNTIREISGGLMFTTSNLMARPLIKHYISTANMQNNIYLRKFVTENSEVYKMSDSMKSSVDNPNAVKSIVADSMIHRESQKDLNNSYTDPKEFIYGFSEEMKSQIKAMKTDKIELEGQYKQIQGEVEALVNVRDTKGTDAYTKALSAYGKYADAYGNAVEMYDRISDRAVEAQEFKDNLFLSYLTFDQINGKVLMKPKTQYSRSTESVKQMVREDFNKLPETMKNKFIDYQLLRNGVNDKIGSMIDMLPQSLHLNTIKRMSDINLNKKEYFDQNKDLVKRNAALALRGNILTNLSESDIIRMAPNRVGFKGKQDLITVDGDIYLKEAEGIYSKVDNKNFQSGPHFIKFGNVVPTKGQATDTEIQELRNNCK